MSTEKCATAPDQTTLIRREAREVVASFYQHQKHEPAYADLIRRGHRDMTAEVRQAEAAMARAFDIAGAWMDVQEPGQARAHRLASYLAGEGGQ